VPAEYADKRIAYICVFDNRNWVPVFYGNIRNGKVAFTSMGRNIVYMAAFYEHGQIVPFDEPFLIKGDGTVQTIQYDDKKRTTLKLLRKYPFMGKEDFFNPFYKMVKDGMGSLCYQGQWSIYDQVIVNHDLAFAPDGGLKLTQINKGYWGRIYKKRFMMSKSGQYKGYPLRTFSNGGFISGYSDHYPTYIVISKEL
jgi:hypothetical protein